LPTPVVPLQQSHMRYSSFTFKIKGIVRKYCIGTNVILNPWFITGLSDADGSFYIALRKDSSCRFGYSLSLEYKIVAGLNPLNLQLLKQVQSFFGGIGIISRDNKTYHYVIRNKNHLRKVLHHFDNYPLQTTKHIHYILWSKVFNMIERKEHSTLTGFMQILAIKAVFEKWLVDMTYGLNLPKSCLRCYKQLRLFTSG